jgi:hypothetical protein
MIDRASAQTLSVRRPLASRVADLQDEVTVRLSGSNAEYSNESESKAQFFRSSTGGSLECHLHEDVCAHIGIRWQMLRRYMLEPNRFVQVHCIRQLGTAA